MQRFNIEEAKDLCHVLAQLKTTEDVMLLLEDICTIQEIEALTQRLDVAKRLSDGMNYEEINRETGVSSATISRVNKCIKYGTGGYELALNILKGENS